MAPDADWLKTYYFSLLFLQHPYLQWEGEFEFGVEKAARGQLDLVRAQGPLGALKEKRGVQFEIHFEWEKVKEKYRFMSWKWTADVDNFI